MTSTRWLNAVTLPLLLFGVIATPAIAQDQQSLIPEKDIASLRVDLEEATRASSSARKKLSLRRVIRSAEGLVKKHADTPKRFEVLHVLFGAQQQLISLDATAANRRALLETCRALAIAPNEYAALRLDADLLLSQAELAQRGADQQARADALKPLVDRYEGTEVEAKVIRIAMLMAIEFGDASLIQHLRETIAGRMPGNLEMINFQRDQLAGQVFGAPFVGRFEGADGKLYRLPMDAMGKTTALYFWSKENDGLQQLKLLAEGWAKVKADQELQAESRYQFLSFNLDGLPDAGESLLREAGVDWPALHLADGQESDIYKTYARNTPKLLTMTPTGYTAMVMSGATRIRPDRTWERSLQSGLARSWSRQRYAAQLQSLLIGDFLVIDPAGDFDPAAPPEWKAAWVGDSQQPNRFQRTASSVPEDKLQAIQACFVKAPMRYRLSPDEVKANYAKAESLCRQAIEQHTEADDLWIVYNRRIVALMGLWKTEGKRQYFDSAIQQAQAAIERGYPAGADVVARFCITRQTLRDAKDDLPGVIDRFVKTDGQEPVSAASYAAASLLALEIADRGQHEQYRRLSLDEYADHPMLWNATSFLLDRYHRYWLYHPPFTAGWTYGRRMGHFLAIGTPEDAERTLQLELKTLEGQAVQLPNDSDGKWTVIEFSPDAERVPYLQRYGIFIKERFVDDVRLISAILDDNAAQASATVAKRTQEQQKRRQSTDHFKTMIVPGGMDHPLVQQLGILNEDERPNIVLIQPDGRIAAMISGLTMSGSKGNAMQSVIEQHDEHLVDQAIGRGDLIEAKRLALLHAPLEQVAPIDGPKHWKPKKIAVPHLRARAKVYAAMQDWEAALADAQEVYLEVNKKAGWLSMRTVELDEIERLRAHIQTELEQSRSNN